MNVLITGGAGYIGSRVAAHLVAAGFRVTILDKLLYGGEGLLTLLDHPDVRFIRGDIRNEMALQDGLQGVQAIVHLAALVGEEACQVEPDATVAINEGSVLNFLRLAAECDVERFIFVSTCSNYGVSASDEVADENSPLHPLSLYAETKVQAEKYVLSLSNPGLAACVLRLGTVCGLSPRMRFNLLVNDMARVAGLGGSISIYSPQAWRPFLHIRDAARAVFACLNATSELMGRQVFNVVSENYQKQQLADLVLRHYPQVTIEITEAATDHRDYRVKAERIAQVLGFNPSHTIEEAFLEMARAVRNGIFTNPRYSVYEALPDQNELADIRLSVLGKKTV